MNLNQEIVRRTREALEFSYRAKKTEMKRRHYEEGDNLAKAHDHDMATLQSVCGHVNKRLEDDFDHHKREEWTKEYCEDCGKFIRRYLGESLQE